MFQYLHSDYNLGSCLYHQVQKCDIVCLSCAAHLSRVPYFKLLLTLHLVVTYGMY